MYPASSISDRPFMYPVLSTSARALRAIWVESENGSPKSKLRGSAGDTDQRHICAIDIADQARSDRDCRMDRLMMRQVTNLVVVRDRGHEIVADRQNRMIEGAEQSDLP